MCAYIYVISTELIEEIGSSPGLIFGIGDNFCLARKCSSYGKILPIGRTYDVIVTFFESVKYHINADI